MGSDQAFKIEEMEFQLNNDQLGVTLGLDLSVSEVKRGTPAFGRIRVGDRIITVTFFLDFFN